MNRDRYQVRVTLTAVPLPAEKKPLFDHSCLMLLDLADSFFENGKNASKNKADDRFIGNGQKGGVRSPYSGKYEIVGSGCGADGRGAPRPYGAEGANMSGTSPDSTSPDGEEGDS